VIEVCPVCGATELSWADRRFGHCQRSLPLIGKGRDTILEGHHPGLGHVTGAADFKKKVDAAKRAGYTVTKPSDVTIPERPRKVNSGPTAWEKTLKAIDNGLLDGL